MRILPPLSVTNILPSEAKAIAHGVLSPSTKVSIYLPGVEVGVIVVVVTVEVVREVDGVVEVMVVVVVVAVGVVMVVVMPVEEVVVGEAVWVGGVVAVVAPGEFWQAAMVTTRPISISDKSTYPPEPALTRIRILTSLTIRLRRYGELPGRAF
jgi:hypothetical protein